MGLAQSLRAVVDQFGGGYDDYDDYDDVFAASDEAVRHDETLARKRDRGVDYDDIYREEPLSRSRRAWERDAPPLSLVRQSNVQVALVAPGDFDDAQQIADRLKSGASVIVDMQGCDRELSGRLTDFLSGLAYALEGSLQRVGSEVVLVSPRDVDLSGGLDADVREKGFYNRL